MGVVVSASLIAASMILNSDNEVLTFEIDLLGHHTLAITDLLELSGYCIATLLGLWLVFSILRSGKL